MPITPNLPPLHGDGPFANLGEYGAWSRAADLRALANALKVGADQLEADDIKSVPDAWAQAHVFHQALLDPDHEMHDAVRSQWRGLLALIALQPEFRTVYDLSVASIKLSDSERAGGKLRRVLKDLEPQSEIIKTQDAWDGLGILYFLERGESRSFAAAKPRVPAALLSPAVLVVAGKSRGELRCANLPWLKNGPSDPLEVPGLAPRHYDILARFLAQMGERLGKQIDHSTEHSELNRLMRQLGDFHRECSERVTQDHRLKAIDGGLVFPAQIYSVLGGTFVFDAESLPSGFSDCRLKTRPELAGAMGRDGLKGAILVDPDMSPDADETISVWKAYSLRDARAPATLAQIKADALSDGWLIVQPSDLFTHDLVRFAEGTDIPGHGRRGFESALLPFSPLLLLLMTTDEIAAAAQMNQTGGECVVTLDLPLLSPEGRPSSRRHRLVRRYGPDRVQDEDRPDDLAIWPNFRSRDWKHTFLRFQYDPEYEIQPRFGLSAEFLAAESYDGKPSLTDRARRLYEWSSADSLIPDQALFADRIGRMPPNGEPLLISRLRFADTTRVIGELQRLPLGVEAIFFARRTDGKGSERPVGMALVTQSDIETNFTDPTVSIDFGTTNTVAYCQKGASKSPIVFQERVVFPVRASEREAEQRGDLTTEYINFFPLKTHAMPFPTVVKRREFQGDLATEVQAQLQRGHNEFGFSDFIFFMPQYDRTKRIDSLRAWIDSNLLVFNIKWAADEATRGLTRRFLRQLMLMVAAELVADGVRPSDVKWRFSYPQAFSRRELGDLKTSIQQAWDELFGEQAGRIRADDQISMRSESAAAASYFMYDEEKRRTSAVNKLMLMLDIGGGTTDVALWYDEKMRWRSSFRMAGGQFFTRYLANNPAILSKIDFGQVASSMGQPNSDNAAHFTELFINAPEFSGNFERAFPSFSMEPEGAGLRHCATVALGGIMYYVGLVMHRLIKEGIIEAKDVQNITVAFGGRGSALFRLFNVGERYDTELTQILRIAVAAATGEDPQGSRPDTQFSAQPKHEVARGLLLDGGGSSRPDSVIAPLGEQISYTDASGEPTSVAAEDDIHLLLGAQSVGEPDLEEFQRFLVGLKKLTGISIDLKARDGEALRVIQRVVSQSFRASVRDATASDDDEGVQLIEPPFITALRALVDVMNLPIAERDGTLSVVEKLR